MKITLWQDETVSFDAVALADNLNRHFNELLEFEGSNKSVRIPGDFISNPRTYNSLLKLDSFSASANTVDRLFIITKKPYDNNYFWDSPDGSLSIFSCFSWEDLTNLPISNGVIYVVALFIANLIELKPPARHNMITGCISDFLWDKKGIDVCMRSAFICPKCLKHSKRKS